MSWRPYAILGYGIEVSNYIIDEQKGTEFALNHGYECIEDMIVDYGLGQIFEMCDESGTLISDRGDETEFLMIAPDYPWFLGEKYKLLTEEDVKNLIVKAMRRLVNDEEEDIRSSVTYIEELCYE